MNNSDLGGAFVERISAEVLNSAAVNHPYLRAIRDGKFADYDLALKDFAFQYGLYSAGFIRYVTALINNLASANHRNILQSNLAEEMGDTHNVDLPAEIAESISGQPHARLYKNFQQALGVDDGYRDNAAKCQTAVLWNRQFLQLCEINECVGVGAVGIGTELIVPAIYKQILAGLKAHSELTNMQCVFFELHSECDAEHSAQLLSIATDLARDPAACEQIEYGARMAVNLRAMFWDRMLARAQNFPALANAKTGSLSVLGYQESL